MFGDPPIDEDEDGSFNRDSELVLAPNDVLSDEAAPGECPLGVNSASMIIKSIQDQYINTLISVPWDWGSGKLLDK